MQFADYGRGLRVLVHVKEDKWIKATVVQKDAKLQKIEVMLEQENRRMQFELSNIRLDVDFTDKKTQYDPADRVIVKMKLIIIFSIIILIILNNK